MSPKCTSQSNTIMIYFHNLLFDLQKFIHTNKNKKSCHSYKVTAADNVWFCLINVTYSIYLSNGSTLELQILISLQIYPPYILLFYYNTNHVVCSRKKIYSVTKTPIFKFYSSKTYDMRSGKIKHTREIGHTYTHSWRKWN